MAVRALALALTAMVAVTMGGACDMDAQAGTIVLNDCPLPEIELGDDTIHLTLQTTSFRTPQGDEVRTKAINGQIPAPLLRWRKGGSPTVVLHNNVTGCSAGGGHECRTNLHTHGLHISGLQDDIAVEVAPGESHTYYYELGSDHAGGLHWYHAHVHTLTELQVGGGAAGLLVVEDHESSEIPPEVLALPQHELMLFHFQPARLQLLAQRLGDSQFQVRAANDAPETYYMVNGFLEPVLRVPRGGWVRLRLLHASPTSSTVLSLARGNCEVHVMGRDGVYYQGGPRAWPGNLGMTQAGRADLLLRCNEDDELVNGFTTLFSLRVDSTLEAQQLPHDPPRFSPCLPAYLDDTRELAPEQIEAGFGIRVSSSAMNGLPYRGTDAAVSHYNMTVGSVHEWVVRSRRHPLHIHVNHFQLQHDVDAWTKAGDWVDTLLADATVRTRIDHFAGPVVMHCHLLFHEDRGAMGVMHVTGSEPSSFPAWEDRCSARVRFLDDACTANAASCARDDQCCSARCFAGTCIPASEGEPSRSPGAEGHRDSSVPLAAAMASGVGVLAAVAGFALGRRRARATPRADAGRELELAA